MILHILLDDKFTDYVIDLFGEIIEVESTFVLISFGKDIIDVKQLDKVRHIDISSESIEKLISEINKYNAIIFHGAFYKWQENLLNKIPNNIYKAWHVYGGEIYGQPDLCYTFLAPFTKIVFILHNLLKKRVNQYFPPKTMLNKMDYCLTSIEEEYSFVKKYIKADENFKYIWYSCYNIEDTVGKKLIDKVSVGSDIWIGNSSTIENNYFDILLKLKKYKIQDRKIIVPLSYGNLWVQRSVLTIGKMLFNKNFLPLIEFLPKEEYNEKMLNCSVMIQPHWRQQAHGNILTGLWLGMRVYLSKRSIEYKFLKRIGIIVFSIEDDLNNNSDIFNRLSIDEMNENRKILSELYGNMKVKNEIFKIAKMLDKKQYTYDRL